MQVASTRSTAWFYVDWWLMNHCSWRCSYCHDIIKSGSIGLPYIHDCTRFVDQLTDHAAKLGKKPSINFTGGEVTEWNNFLDLISHAHRLGCITQFRSNANLPADDWAKLLQYTNRVTVEYHPEHSQASQFLIAVDRAVKMGVEVQVNVNMLKESWQELDQLAEYIKVKWPSVSVNKKMLFDDPVHNTTPNSYEQPQIIKLKLQTGDLKFTDHELTEYTDYQTLVLENKNAFKGWQCWVGLEQIVVDAWGRIYRAHCRHNGFIGNLKDSQAKWPTEAITCPVDHCRNGFDILATKRKN